MENIPEEKLEQEKKLKAARTVWMILIPLFGILALFNLYRLTQGRDDALSSVLSQSGMVFVGLAMLISSRNKPLSYIFSVLGIIAVTAGLVMVIISLQN